METEEFTTKDVYESLCQVLPHQNDFANSDYSEELEELLFFGIHTKPALEALLVKHKDRLMRIDAEPLDDFHIKVYKEEYGDDYIQHKIHNKFWFAYPALLRLALELEYGEKYIEYANKRDKV